MVLNDLKRALGGSTRAQSQEQWERSFLAMLGGSSRPPKHDNKLTGEQTDEQLQDLGKKYPWIVFCAIGRDGTLIRYGTPREKVIKRVRASGGVAGFAGAVLFPSNGTIQIYTRQLLTDSASRKKLTEAADAIKSMGEEFLRERTAERALAGEKSPLWADVFTNGKWLSMFYSWEPAEKPEAEFVKIGRVYLARTERGTWEVQANFPEDSSAKMMAIASQRFAKKLDELQRALRALEVK